MNTIEKASVETLAALLEALNSMQPETQTKIVEKLKALGYYQIGGMTTISHPTDSNATIFIKFREDRDYEKEVSTYSDLEIYIERPHEHSHSCDSNCDDEIEHDHDVSVELVLEAIRADLHAQIERTQNMIEWDEEFGNTLPDVEEIRRIRRQIEEYLRKNKKFILPVAKLLRIF